MRRLLVCLSLLCSAALLSLTGGTASLPIAEAEASFVQPVVFEANRGQAPAEVGFLARSPGGTVFLTDDSAVVTVARTQVERRAGRPDSVTAHEQTGVWMRWLGARRAARISGYGRLQSSSSYFRGSDAGGGPITVEHYAGVRYEAVYPGVDLVFRGSGQLLEYDFVVAPGADPGQIRLRFEEMDGLRLDEAGDLLIESGAQVLVHHAPVVFQPGAGAAARTSVDGAFELRADDEVGFRLGDYDPDRALIIDPSLKFSTYAGGTANDSAEEIVVDSKRFSYVAGWTCAADFPTKKPMQAASAGGCDAFVARYKKNGKLQQATYLGGSANDAARSIHIGSPAASAGGEMRAGPYVYVTGFTSSTDFPMMNPFDTPRGDAGDVWVAVLSETLSQLLFSTAIGGNGFDFPNDILNNAHGYIIITGSTESKDWPKVQQTQNNMKTPSDPFVAMMDPALSGGSSELKFSTVHGGKGSGSGYGVKLSSANGTTRAADECIHVTGITDARNFPTKSALQNSNAGGMDAFLAKWCNVLVDPEVVYSSYYGGSGNDFSHDLAHDSAGRDVIVLETYSPDLPVTADAFQPGYAGNGDAGIAVFDLRTLTAAPAARQVATMAFASYHGGSELDAGNGIAVDSQDMAHLAGLSRSPDLPTVKPLQGYRGAADVLVAKVDYGAADLTAGRATVPGLLFSSHFGGSLDDVANGICVDSKRWEYLAGFSNSTDYKTKKAAQGGSGGAFDAVVTQIKR